MLRILLTATTALTLMSGVGFAQSSTSTTTTEVRPAVPASRDVDVTTTTRRTESRNGVMIEKDTDSTEVAKPGSPGISRSTTDTTTVR